MVDTSGTTFAECFNVLGGKKKYILILTSEGGNERVFNPIEPPVQSDRKKDQKHRQIIWEKLCAKVEGQETCKTRVSVPLSEDIYRGRLHIMECKVESSSSINSIHWDKDGRRLGLDVHEKAGIIISGDSSSSIVIIQHANIIHNGRYGCTATSADGQTARGYTTLHVVGPHESSRMLCPEDGYCVNGGVCYQEPDGSHRYCECPSSFTGARCDDIYFDIQPSGNDNVKAMESQVSQLTAAVVLVAIAFAAVLFFGSIYVFQLRKKVSKSQDQYVAVEQCCPPFNQQLDGRTTSSNSGRTEVTQSRLSTTVVPDVSQSRRSSALVVNETPSGSKREHLTPRVSVSSQYDFNLKSTSANSISRHSSIASDRSLRRERLNAKS